MTLCNNELGGLERENQHRWGHCRILWTLATEPMMVEREPTTENAVLVFRDRTNGEGAASGGMVEEGGGAGMKGWIEGAAETAFVSAFSLVAGLPLLGL
uniref:Uncharacterized protein n=1 Tax=Chromera velia CCMP2878 TaxID=1169474 RepID=A0A0G4G2F7_9ALVE|eukprot:Cvel_4089.t1-p1 / transcript=Cvel_4089.t1 / gene=Cvel_4089 / organism=Chromera_velia_CCMP2878 / gene_product=hypothetical protein / transcript_product=hypothetical protein / location=Cvel_scaffold174:38336-38629(-) / protein_length=98 / sequence_SO=supercontig / SO=protein_coding / is_pseudo=false